MNSPIYLGATFNTLAGLKQKIQEYEDANFITLYLRDSKPLKKHKLSNPGRFGNISSELKYVFLMYRCKRGGKKFVSRSTGIRKKRADCWSDCPMYIKLSMTDGGYLQVVAMNDRHNHDINQEEYLMNPKKRRLDENEQTEVKRLLRSGVKSSLIREYIKRKTGKTIFSRDICNMMMREKRKSKSKGETNAELENLLKTDSPEDAVFETTDSLQEVPVHDTELSEVFVKNDDDFTTSSNEAPDSKHIIMTDGYEHKLPDVPNKATAFCTYLASELDNLPSQECDGLIEHITLKLFEVKHKLRK